MLDEVSQLKLTKILANARTKQGCCFLEGNVVRNMDSKMIAHHDFCGIPSL